MGGPQDSSPAASQPNTGALSGFQQRRLDLADMLRAALPVAQAHADEQRKEEIRALLNRLAAGRFQLAVAGQFSRGKTTLMNALLGGAYLPMGALPMTSVVTTVRYGARARALVRSRAAGLPIEVPVADVARFIAKASAERTRMQVASVEVEIPAELLRLGFEFVDTPGVGSAIAANTAATMRYLPHADAVIFVTGFDSALTEGETEFLTQAAGQAGKLFLVINKLDLLTDSAAGEVTDYVERWARQNLGAAGPQVFGLSALHALESVLQPDSQRLGRSGIEPFRATLTRFLTAERGKASLAAVAQAAASLLARQQRDMRAGRLAEGSGRDQGVVTAEFDARMDDLQAEIATAGIRIAASVEEVLPSRLAELRPAWQASLRGLVASGLMLDPVMTAADALRAAVGSLELAGRQAASSWLEQRAAEVQEA
ncbi:MAG: dynamin family protein, partial [Streptosporangiaceae bacterium]